MAPLALLLGAAGGPAPAQSPGLAWEGPPGTLFGSAVLVGDDYGGDGFLDVVVGIPQAGSGRVEGYSGVDGHQIFVLNGERPRDRLGESVAKAGDVDADGIGDLIVGAPSDPGELGPSYVRVYSGRDGEVLHHFENPWPNILYGRAVAGVGDLDADGHDDVAVGTPFGPLPVPGSNGGMVEIFSGRTGAMLFRLLGEADSDNFGIALAPLGDVNGDAVPDLAIGARQWNVASGPRPGYARVHSGADGSVIHHWDGLGAEDDYGSSVAAVRDLSGDGVRELLVGAPQIFHPNPAVPYAEGYVQLRSGATGALLAELRGDSLGDHFGAAVSSAGDFNGDGVADFLIGAPQTDGEPRGYARVYSGIDARVLAELRGRSPIEEIGRAVSGGGDIDGDGFDDVVVGSRGGAYAYFGAAMILSASPGIAGATNELRVVDATPGRLILYASSPKLGSATLPGCGGLVTDLAAPSLVGAAATNSIGRASVFVDVPASAGGTTIHLQALEPASCALSNVLSHDFP